MSKLLFLLLIGYGIYLLLRSRKAIPPGSKTAHDESVTHKDPVCGMYVAREDAIVGNLEGKKLYFCSMECLEKYRDQLDHVG